MKITYLMMYLFFIWGFSEKQMAVAVAVAGVGSHFIYTFKYKKSKAALEYICRIEVSEGTKGANSNQWVQRNQFGMPRNIRSIYYTL